MTPVWLPKDTYVCVSDSVAIFLDLKRDQYVGVGSEHFPTLHRLLNGGAEPQSDAADSECIQELISQGLLTRDRQAGKPVASTHVIVASSPLTDRPAPHPPAIRFSHVFRLMMAWLISELYLRRRLPRAVRRAQARKRRTGTHKRSIDREAVTELVRIFYGLRPLFFASRDKCLFTSMVLLEFLARYGIAATWVFGVKTAPFAAHCWVQEGVFVLTDTPENIQTYLPILAV